MIKKVLIVDDDRIMLRLAEKKFQKYQSRFTIVTAQDGLQAVEKLKDETISLVVTDLQMPKMDGFALLAHLSENYPDIPVIILTAYSSQTSRKAVLEGGAAGFMEKPFVVEKLAKKITNTLKREYEGGILQTVPLDMFLQLVEMEQKTCTIRIVNKLSGTAGVLFFMSGILADARIQDVKGMAAAYEIFSWDKVTLSIQDTCAIEKRQIQEDLQAILMEAMRRKDEAQLEELKYKKREFEITHDPVPELAEKEAARPKSSDLIETDPLTKKMDKLIHERKWLKDIYQDNQWDPLVKLFMDLKPLFNAKDLKVCFINCEDSTDFILLPGEKTSVITIAPQCPRDRILQVLSE